MNKDTLDASKEEEENEDSQGGGVLARRATTYEDFLARQGLVMVLVAGDCRNMIGGSTI